MPGDARRRHDDRHYPPRRFARWTTRQRRKLRGLTVAVLPLPLGVNLPRAHAIVALLDALGHGRPATTRDEANPLKPAAA